MYATVAKMLAFGVARHPDTRNLRLPSNVSDCGACPTAQGIGRATFTPQRACHACQRESRSYLGSRSYAKEDSSLG